MNFRPDTYPIGGEASIVSLQEAESFLNFGVWQFEIEASQSAWSRQTYKILGIPEDESAPDVDASIALIHPDDRERILAQWNNLVEGKSSRIEEAYRIISTDGETRHVLARGVRVAVEGRHIITGFLHDVTEIKEREEELSMQTRRGVQARRLAKLGWWIVPLNETHVIWDDETAHIHEEPKGTSPTRDEQIAYFLPSHRERIRTLIETCARQGQEFEETAWITTAKVRQICVNVIGQALRDEAGQIVAVEGAFQDITELVSARTEVTQLSDRLHTTIEGMKEAFVLLDNESRFVFANRQAEKLLEREWSGLIDQTPCEEFPEIGDDKLETLRQEAEVSKTAVEDEFYFPSLQKYFEINVESTDDGLAVFLSDITKQREQQRELMLLATVVAQQNDIVLITEAEPIDGPEGPKIIFVNDAFERCTGYTREEVIGQTPRILQGPKTQETELRRIKEAMEKWQSVRAELINYKKCGEEFWLEMDLVPLADDKGRFTHWIAVERDITERKRLEGQLREAQKLEAVGQLTGGVAHDFNNLLTVILGNAELIAERASDPEICRMAEVTVSAAERGADLTGRLLAFARRKPLNPKPTNINKLVDAMQPLFRRTLPESIGIELALDPELGIAEIDAGELDTALLNLVVNARDAMEGDGKLTIETANVMLDEHYAYSQIEVAPGEYVMICVSDTGKGMDAETRRKAFEPFYTTKDAGKGSGLGLSMVFGFTKQSGGHIKIYSEPGEGTAVKLYFPRVSTEQETVERYVREVPLKGGTEHILIAEDDELVLENLKNQLVSLGYRVSSAMSGQEALEVMQAHGDIALLLTDIIMPGGMNGRELADKAQLAQPSLKVLFTTGYAENAMLHRGRLGAGVALLSKPYSRLELATKVRRVLDEDRGELA